MSFSTSSFEQIRSRMLWVKCLAAVGLLSLTLAPGFGQPPVDPDVDRPPVRPPVEPPDRPDFSRGLPPETADTPVTRPATLMTFTGKAGMVEEDEDQVTLMLDDGDEQKTFTVDPKAKITLNGKPARLKDVLAGDILKIVAHKADPSVARSIVAARVTEHVSGDSERRGSSATEGGRGGSRAAQAGSRRSQTMAAAANSGMNGGMVVPLQGRVFVLQIAQGSAAAQAGFRPGDTIVVVGPNNILPNNTILTGDGVNLTNSRLDTGLLFMPAGAGLNGTNTGAAAVEGAGTTVVPGRGVVPAAPGVVLPGAVAPGVGGATGTDNQDQTGNQGQTGNQNQPGNPTGNQAGQSANQPQSQPATGTGTRGAGTGNAGPGASGAGAAGTRGGSGAGTGTGTGGAGARTGTGGGGTNP